MAQDEIALSGGNTNQVGRIGNVVHRHPMKGSRAVEALLLELQRKGFKYAPHFLGRNDSGREMLSYIEGEDALVGQTFLSQPILLQAVEALQLFHDLSAQLLVAEHDWQFSYPDQARHQTICHNDFGPYNLIVKNGQLAGIIDYDLCGPGPRIRDIAYLAYWLTPLSFAADDLVEFTNAELAAGCPRLHLICDTYGGIDIQELLAMVAEVLSFMSSFEEMFKLLGEKTAIKLKDEGHLRHWQIEARAFVENQARILDAFQ
ncbi:phosphotransferase [Maritalea porphyrae]|uniref:Trifolitoxin immunity domain-containing protein n=1 Tax=Maritalea porphyrae TaxID=880732 RepID=A0ABQ5UPI4_9HYPH|nr:phosphotransferase [Maritalea porphyrae]GLQ17164.1 trifolitoxin immunity domain-containing protein [Maritalea porphyrae]